MLKACAEVWKNVDVSQLKIAMRKYLAKEPKVPEGKVNVILLQGRSGGGFIIQIVNLKSFKKHIFESGMTCFHYYSKCSNLLLIGCTFIYN